MQDGTRANSAETQGSRMLSRLLVSTAQSVTLGSAAAVRSVLEVNRGITNGCVCSAVTSVRDITGD